LQFRYRGSHRESAVAQLSTLGVITTRLDNMGIEYKIVCDKVAVSRFDEFIRSQSFFESYDAERHLYNLRVPGISKTEDFPDGYATIESDGIYFCDNLTATDSAASILRKLIDQALLHSDKIIVHEP
jgi:hypothetical protein